MSHIQDTYWERHPPVGGDGHYRPGLRLYEHVGAVRLYTFIPVVVFGVLLLILLELQAPGWLNALVLLFFAAVLAADIAWPALTLGRRRYRLYDDECDTPEFDGKPEKLATLLEEIANSERLWKRLAPPGHRAHPGSVFRVALPTTSSLLPMYLMLGVISLLSLSALLVLTPRSTLEVSFFLLFLFGFLLSLLPVWLAFRRVRLGIQVLGSGDTSLDGDSVLAGFEEASHVELHWDRWLGIPYLLVDLYGAPVRYYSSCEEPLHLLRIAKFRIPHLKLRVPAG